MSSKHQKRNVGELGEDVFKRWCTLAGLSAVKSSPDRMGWDYFVEFVPDARPGVPLDRQNELVKMLIQVKSSDRRSESVKGKLSALKYLVDADLPAFIIQIEFADQRHPQRVRLLHIGSSEIEAILCGVRIQEKRGRKDLHNIKMSLPLNDAIDLMVDGENLFEALRGVVSGSSSEYIHKKARFRSACGYDERSIKGHITLASGLKVGAVVDLLIGRIPSIPISGMVVEKTRFGISLDGDIEKIGPATLTVNVQPFCNGAFRVRGRSRCIELAADVYAPAIPGISVDLQKLRVANEFAELIVPFDSGEVSFKYSIDPKICYPLNVLAKAVAFAVTMSEDDAILEVDLGNIGKSSFLVPKGKANFLHLGLLNEFIDLLAAELFRYSERCELKFSIQCMQRVLDANLDGFSLMVRPGLEFSGVMNDCHDVLPNAGAAFVPAYLEFGNFVYAAIVRADAQEIIITENKKIKLKFSYPSIIEGGIVERSELDVGRLNKRVEELAQRENSKTRFSVSLAIDAPLWARHAALRP